MPHLHRFYTAPEAVSGGEAVLEAEEAHHALHVVRLRVGEPVALFDGMGREWLGHIARIGKREVAAALETCRSTPRPAPELTVAQAWLLRDKALEFLVQHGTEVGVTRFAFFRAKRSERSPKINEKWRRIAIEACKQCGRLWLPTFEEVADLAQALEKAPGARLIATMDVPPVSWPNAVQGQDAVIGIGPEGDFTPEEVSTALALGAQPVSLGASIFRAEVAAVLAAALLRHYQGGLGPLDAG